MFAYIYVCLPPAYAHLFMLIFSCNCLCYLCMLMFIIYQLMGHDISEGIFHWTMRYGRKGSVYFSTISGKEDLCI
jgi:hypothetical protein